MGSGLTFFDTAEAYNGPENTNSFGGFAQGAASSEVRVVQWHSSNTQAMS